MNDGMNETSSKLFAFCPEKNHQNKFGTHSIIAESYLFVCLNHTQKSTVNKLGNVAGGNNALKETI